MKESQKSAEAADLRRQAEERLKTQKRIPQSSADIQKLIHELQVHQIELEMQNEEMFQSRAEVEVGLESYTVLYDFAPVGYFTIDRDGTICQANLTGARLLGVERARLVNRRFGLFISEADRPAFNAFLKKAFESKTKEVFEVALLKKEETGSLWVQIEALASEDRQECRAVLVDITDRKRAEIKLNEQLDELRRWHEITLGRETRILDLKREVNELLAKIGQPPRYESAVTDSKRSDQ